MVFKEQVNKFKNMVFCNPSKKIKIKNMVILHNCDHKGKKS